MSIRHAEITELSTVERIVRETIREIYPRYYPKGAVEFFLAHHSTERISSDIEARNVYIFCEYNAPIGTITVSGNEVSRLFIMPLYQGKGYGGALMDFAEKLISESFEFAELHASFPGKQMYLRRGYKEVDYRTAVTENGDVLCVDIMEKRFA